MFIRWRRRPLRRTQDTALDALLVQSVWQAGRARQRVIRYLATIPERYRLAPAHRSAFWQHVDQRLATVTLSPAARQALEAHLVQQVARPTPAELAEVRAWRQTLAQWSAPPRSDTIPRVHGAAALHGNGH